jgi:hypothetical protein
MGKMLLLRNEKGVIGLSFLLALPVVLALCVYLVGSFRAMRHRAAVQELADSAAMHAAAMQARNLNLMAGMNDGILGIDGLAAGVFTFGNAVGFILDLGIVTLPEGLDLHHQTFDLTKQLRDLSNQVADVQDALIQSATFSPLLASQLPNHLTPKPGFKAYIIPYPLPNLSLKLAIEMPFAKRDVSFSNFSKVASEKVAEQISERNGKITAAANKVLKYIAENGCPDEPAATKNGQPKVKNKNIWDAAGQVAKDTLKNVETGVDVGTAATVRIASGDFSFAIDPKALLMKEEAAQFCRNLLLTQKDLLASGGDRFAKLLAEAFKREQPRPKDSGSSKEQGEDREILGFSLPVPLIDNYTESYQVGAIVIACPPSSAKDCDLLKALDFKDKSPYFAIAQARARSFSQRGGGGLFFPDFSARLVPVSPLSDFLGGGEDGGDGKLLAEGPWAARH